MCGGSPLPGWSFQLVLHPLESLTNGIAFDDEYALNSTRVFLLRQRKSGNTLRQTITDLNVEAARNDLCNVSLQEEIVSAHLGSLDDSLTVLVLILSFLLQTPHDRVVDVAHEPFLQ